MREFKQFLLSFAIFTIVLCINVAHAQIVISDTTFNPADWSVTASSAGGASQTNLQELTGGNPGAFRSMQHILPSPPRPTDLGLIEVTHIYEAASYNPGTQGAIDHIDYSEDTALLSLPYANQPFVRSFAVVVQGGKAYRSASPLVVIGTTSWTNGSLTGLSANDFIALDGSNAKPDFSDSGESIKVGFWRNHSRVGDTPVPYNQNLTIEHGIDNFSATIYPVVPQTGVTCTLEVIFATLTGTETMPTATILEDGQPAEGVVVDFTVNSGPNAGKAGGDTTDAAGQATFSYRGDGGLGTDIIEASGTVAGVGFSCTAQVKWVANLPPVARHDTFVINALTTGDVFLSVLLNDFDPDSDPIVISSIIPLGIPQTTHGTVDNRGTFLLHSQTGWRNTGFFYAITDGEFFDTTSVAIIIDCACVLECATNTFSTFNAAPSDSFDLDLIRRFRDEVLQSTEVGSSYVDIYYNRTPEIAKILILDRPDIGSQAVRMVEMMQPALRNLLDGDGSVVFTQALIDTIGTFFDSLFVAGSDSLQQLIADEFARVGPLDDYVGLSVKNVINIALGDSVATAITDEIQTVPTGFVLQQNFPNPFNPSTILSYSLPAAADVELIITDILGREVVTLVKARQQAGNHLVTFEATGLPSGIYFYRIRTERFVKTRKMLLLR